MERNTAAEIVDRKKEAIAAVAAAKKDLLKHSLDMMVRNTYRDYNCLVLILTSCFI